MDHALNIFWMYHTINQKIDVQCHLFNLSKCWWLGVYIRDGWNHILLLLYIRLFLELAFSITYNHFIFLQITETELKHLMKAAFQWLSNIKGKKRKVRSKYGKNCCRDHFTFQQQVFIFHIDIFSNKLSLYSYHNKFLKKKYSMLGLKLMVHF